MDGLPHPSQVSVLLHFPSHPCLEACLEACLILAKCLFCSTFYRIHGNFHSLEACLEACLQACLILTKSLFCSTFHSINGTFHSLEACLEACLILAKCLFCCSFHSILWQFPYPWIEPIKLQQIVGVYDPVNWRVMGKLLNRMSLSCSSNPKGARRYQTRSKPCHLADVYHG